jgi:hypothetical protein
MKNHANLLVVFMLVLLYISKRAESRPVLSWLGCQSQGAPKGARLFAGGHDFFWVFGSSLAAGRGWTTHHRNDLASYLRGFPNSDVETGSEAGREGSLRVG